ncbi:MAG: amidohydrolase family protein [Bacteroidota bacterium]
MTQYYDIHNHLFNKNFLAKELLYRMMREMKKFLEVQKDRKLDRGPDRGLKKVITSLKRYRKALKVFALKDSVAIYEELNRTYKGEFILTPLTFDLTFCFAPSPDRDAPTATPGDVARAAFESEMNEMFSVIEQQTRSLSKANNRTATEGEDWIYREYTEEKELFIREAELFMQPEGVTGTGSGTRSAGNRIPAVLDGWAEQLRQIEDIKNHHEYKDKVFPFLAVDPRRDKISEYARENMGKGKLFVGLKLYCPTGYSPTDPLLYGTDGNRDGLYAFCEDNGIPVTTHNSDGGFATLANSVFITGDIQVNGKLHQLNNERVKFSKAVYEKDGIYERALTLNHPLLWEKVVQKYPGLILNLAHFGGGRQLDAALTYPDDPTLWSNKIIALLKDNRYKVYTDVSCFTEFSTIDKLIESPVYPEIRHKILFGSDYTLLLLFEDDFNENIRQFRLRFGSNFDIIANENPREFLKHVI